MNTQVMRREGVPLEIYHEWTPESLKAAVEREKQLRETMIDYYKSVMRNGHHYYRMTERDEDKPSLTKEGALNLNSLFKVKAMLAEPQETYHTDGHYTVRYRVDLVSSTTGEVVATGDGLCTTRESKYAYRWAFASEISSDVDREKLVKRERQSKTGKPYTQYKLPNPDLADCYNTCLKISLKRALVDATLKLPLVSELFTQDLEPEIHERVQDARQDREERSQRSATASHTSADDDEKALRATLMSAILETLRTIPEREKRRDWSQTAFGCDWAGMKGLTVAQLQEGYETLQELMNAEARDGEDVPEHPPTVETPSTAEDLATPAQLDALKALAQEVGNDAYADVQDFLDHNPRGIPLDNYQTVKARLEQRLRAGGHAPEPSTEAQLLTTEG